LKRLILSVVLMLSISPALPAEEVLGYYRFPAIHGDSVVFSAEGDLWWVNRQGGIATRLTTHPAEETRPAISPDGRTAFTTDRNRDVVVWDLAGVDRFGRRFTAGNGLGEFPWFAISPDGETIAVPSSREGYRFGEGGEVELIDASTLRIRAVIPYGDATPEGLGFSPDSATLAIGAWSFDRFVSEVRLWDVESGRPISDDLPGIAPNSIVWGLSYSPDGSMIAGASRILVEDTPGYGRVYLWRDGPDAEPEHLDVAHPVNQAMFSPDGSVLVAVTGWANAGQVVLVDPRGVRIDRRFPTDDAATLSVDVANDGRLLVSGGQTSNVHLFRIADGRPVGSPMTGLTGWADTVDVSADGTMVVGADSDGHVVLWDTATGAALGDPFPGPERGDYLAAMFSPDGRHVVVVSDTGAGWVWNVDPTEWRARACAVAGRTLSPSEWQEFIPDRPYEPSCAA